ncbi:aspartate aminotransferase [Parapedobacter defluvii]|uniref:Aspartate aminotransferase n=1 Tax=Parapedobacter defluvii TaxID=2045106 RepID=A0ABQ1MZW4_9SPHI|nr:pyridoxal phosphate-dependent aminotransferase [Parapedobacter defluvii]GGC49698.1 aspartate aminotransferase [Parapedobacter defluvii]
MPAISIKGDEMPASPIRKLTPYAEKAKREGKHVYHLNIGQPDIETPQIMLDAVRNINFKVWAYTPSEGIESYRNKLAGYYNKLGYAIHADDILVTNGGSEALSFAMQACVNPGEEIIIPEPFYANYNSFTRSAGIDVIPILSRIDEGFALPPIADFEAAVTSKTRAIAICNPNNPTGYLYSREEMEALRDLCLKYDLFLLVDEAYREFCYDGREFVSPMQLDGLEQHTVVVDTISKRYSACGARLGCLITKNKELWNVVLKFAQARLSAPAVAQIAAEAAIDTPQSYFDAVKKEYTARRDTLVTGLNAIDGVFCPNPGGAFYVVARLPVDDADRFCQWMLEYFSYENQTVMMAPASGFYNTPEAGKNEVRLAYVLNRDDLKRALICLERGLVDYPGRIGL